MLTERSNQMTAVLAMLVWAVDNLPCSGLRTLLQSDESALLTGIDVKIGVLVAFSCSAWLASQSKDRWSAIRVGGGCIPLLLGWSGVSGLASQTTLC
jgi:hypothetical protein